MKGKQVKTDRKFDICKDVNYTMCFGVVNIGCVTFFNTSVKCTIAIIWCPCL